MGFFSTFQWCTKFGNAENAVPASEFGFSVFKLCLGFSAVSRRKISSFESLQFRVPVNTRKSFFGAYLPEKV